ncbi:MAG TPA: hypothetical protein VF594_11735, partial [Rubricoccaceae bacterium]
MPSDVPFRSPAPLPGVAVVGEEAELVRALTAMGVPVGDGIREAPARIVVVAGPVEGRAAAARAAVAAGQHTFVAWPPGALAEAETLLRDAEEAGVEVGVERPLVWPPTEAAHPAGAPAPLVSVTVVTDGAA